MLPKNGRIVIVDDKPSEADPLMKILSKKRIPFNYYSGLDMSDFPEDPTGNTFRVLFLDLNIVETNQKVADVISVLNGILRKLIPNNPNPYLLVIWSKKKEYREALITHFDEILPKKKPVKIVFLDKGKYFDFDPEDGGYIPQNGSYERLRDDLHNELSDLSLLGSLFVWENLVHKNTTDTVNEFSSLYQIGDDWDAKSKILIYQLAKAFVGSEAVTGLSDSVKLITAFGNLNSFLSDRLESEVVTEDFGTVANITDGVAVAAEVKAKINSKLHVSSVQPNLNSFEQGNVYYLPREIEKLKAIVSKKTINGAETKINEILRSKPKQLQLDITPTCDYAQDKGYVRLIHGVMLSGSFFANLNKKAPIYICSTPILQIGAEQKFIIFDFRFIETITKKIVISRGIKPVLRLRKEICTDIQSQLSNQINRPGISNL